MFPKDFTVAQHQQIGRQQTRPNTLVSAASFRWRTLAKKVYCTNFNTLLLWWEPQIFYSHVNILLVYEMLSDMCTIYYKYDYYSKLQCLVTS